MQKINYIIASVYKGIANKVKNDTPYFNTLMLLFFAFAIHFAQIIILIKLFAFDLLKNVNRSTFIALFILSISMVVLLLAKVFPLKKISLIEVRDEDVKKYYTLMIIYFIFSILILIIFLILLKNKTGL